MAELRDRQFGFTFLLFVPLLAYWGYDTFVKWYMQRRKTLDHHDEVCSENAGATDICDGPSQGAEANMCPETALTAEAYSTAFTNIQQGVIVQQDCLVLISLLRSSDTTRLTDGLQLVLKLSVTTAETKNLLLNNGIDSELSRIVRCSGDLPDAVAALAINAVNNLSLSEEGQLKFVELVEQLADVCVGGDSSLAVTALQCLTNLSVTSHSHQRFPKVVQSLYNLLDTHPGRQLSVCRVLVNLSSSCVAVPYLLAAKRPECSTQLMLDSSGIALRWLRFLTNISQIVLSEGITEPALPTIYKAASPETMYSFMYGVANHSEITGALLGTKSGSDEELQQLSNQLYKNINLRLLSVPSQS